LLLLYSHTKKDTLRTDAAATWIKAMGFYTYTCRLEAFWITGVSLTLSEVKRSEPNKKRMIALLMIGVFPKNFADFSRNQTETRDQKVIHSRTFVSLNLSILFVKFIEELT
jgi:hypothetical protein